MFYLLQKNFQERGICSKKWDCVKIVLLLVCSTLILWACQHTAAPVTTLQPPERITKAEEKYAGVFKMLDGQWRGTFYIYEDPSYMSRRGPDRQVQADFNLKQAGFMAVDSIAVYQSYRSESPYYQTVKIQDSYTSPNGEQKEVISLGVNKVQQGGLWCVLQKPDKKVVHSGQLLDKQTIIWSRQEQVPQRIEWFRETVTDSVYSIVGWGYYSGDDPQVGPPLWFTAKYIKQEDQISNE
jgi:hypothetical protein